MFLLYFVVSKFVQLLNTFENVSFRLFMSSIYCILVLITQQFKTSSSKKHREKEIKKLVFAKEPRATGKVGLADFLYFLRACGSKSGLFSHDASNLRTIL